MGPGLQPGPIPIGDKAYFAADSGSGLFAVLLPEHPFQDFTRGAGRKGCQHDHTLGDLVSRHIPFTVCNYFVFCACFAGPRNNEGSNHFDPFGIREAQYGCLHDLWMFGDHSFHFLRRYILAAALYHVLFLST